MRRYPFQALADAMNMTLAELGRHLNISGSTFKAMRENGLSEAAADRRAVQCGLDPYRVWPEMIDHAIEDEQAARRAKKREYQRRYYARHAEEIRERNRRYWAETADYQRTRRQRHRQANPDTVRAQERERYAAKRRNSEAA